MCANEIYMFHSAKSTFYSFSLYQRHLTGSLISKGNFKFSLSRSMDFTPFQVPYSSFDEIRRIDNLDFKYFEFCQESFIVSPFDFSFLPLYVVANQDCSLTSFVSHSLNQNQIFITTVFEFHRSIL